MHNSHYLELNWLPAHQFYPLPEDLAEWLLDAGSFMQRLLRHGVMSSKVQLLKQNWQIPVVNEKNILGISARSYALIREVLISNLHNKWMFARTVFPRSTLTGKQKCLARLKNRSLGSILFKEPTVQRSSFEMAKITPGTGMHHFITQHTKIIAPEIWARRSLFTWQHKSLLLSEFFLPDLNSLCK